MSECLTPINALNWTKPSAGFVSEQTSEHPWLLNATMKDPNNYVASHISELERTHGAGVTASLAISANGGGWYAWENWASGEKCCFNPLLRINAEKDGALFLVIDVIFLKNGEPIEWWKGTEVQLKGEFDLTAPKPWETGKYFYRSRASEGQPIHGGWTGIEWKSFKMSHPVNEPRIGLGLLLEAKDKASPIIVGELLIDP